MLLIVVSVVGRAAAIDNPPHYTNPVWSGDFPDPSVVWIGPEYWAAATASSGGFPPIMRSPDLVHWTPAGSIFQQAPAWTDGQAYWAPEIDREDDHYLAYYSARRETTGGMCVGVASSAEPIGPYQDQGPLVCQHDGSIDPTVVRNSSGWPFLVWKEDRNSEGATSAIWIQPLAADGLSLTGVRRKILTATGRGWEGGVVEGPQIVRRKGWNYLFYSGNLCCGPNCEYAMGVARSRGLYGPWTRFRRNPILDSDDDWLCPGHGSVAQSPDGRWWMLYASYNAVGTISPQRTLLLDPIRWSRDAWPVVNGGKGPSAGH